MHFKTENEMNSNANYTTTATITTTPRAAAAPKATPKTTAATNASTNCTSSTESGVIIIDDNKTIFNNKCNNNNNYSQKNSSNSNGDINKKTTTATPTPTPTTTTTTATEDNSSNKETKRDTATHEEQLNNKRKNIINQSDKSIGSNNINIKNIINISKGSRNSGAQPNNHPTTQPTCRPGSTTSSAGSKNCSPSVSIRSTTISIVSIDENAIDSSVVDTDSECEVDAEGVHSNYIVKKLGQQTTYGPDSPDLPNINKGLTVLSQQISPGGLSATVGPLAQNLLNGGLCPAATPTTPQIGSIALTNSTDVTFGDKHFYEGPVTIQQFLIDSRDKWQQHENGDEDERGSKENDTDAAIDVDNAPLQHEQPYKFIFNRKAVIVTGTIIVLTILIGILIVVTSSFFKSSIRKSKLLGDGDDSRKNIPINSTIDLDDNDDFNSTLHLVSRKEWNARTPKGVMDKLKLPVHRVIISHTASETCQNKDMCFNRMQVIQNYHMDSYGWDDIGYNFVIGGDGRVYVGRGWDNQGAHTKGYNSDSVGISFIGTFMKIKPTEKALSALQLLMAEGVRLKKLVADYRLYGARQFSGTESPGEAMFNISDMDNIGGGNILRIVPRDGWLAQPPSSPPIPLNLPVSRVIIISTQTEACTTQAACTFRVRFIQTFNIESQRLDDIVYNFLIGGDGNVYEGRSWDFEGAHLKGFNDGSVSFAYVGTFRVQKPNEKQMNVTKLLLNEGVRTGKLAADYKIFSANKLDPTSTATSAEALYESFENWPHWSKNATSN